MPYKRFNSFRRNCSCDNDTKPHEYEHEREHTHNHNHNHNNNYGWDCGCSSLPNWTPPVPPTPLYMPAFAEFVQTATSLANTAVVPNAVTTPATANSCFFFGTPSIVNNINGLSIGSATNGGSIFQFANPGTFIIDYEMSLTTAGAIAIYRSAGLTPLGIDNNTIAGSTSPTTWIHGRAIESFSAGDIMIVSPVPITAPPATFTVAGYGIATQTVARITFLQVA